MEIKNNKIKITVRALVWTSFTVYCLVLIKLLFLDGRVRFDAGFSAYLQHSNWIPLRTIIGYFQKLAEGRINSDIVIRNILGNLVVFLPMGCYLSCLGAWFRPAHRSLLVLLGMICAVETMQLVLRVGFFDIDDILFNFAGAAAGVGILRIPPLQRVLERLWILKKKPNAISSEHNN